LYLNSNANRFAMVGRLRPFNGMIQPYGDLSAGIETFRTKTTINVISDNTGYSEGNNAQTQQFDMTVFYSWAAGMRIRMTNHLFLDMRFENLVGGSATYVDGESVVITSEEEISFNTKTSKTDKYTYTLGLSVSF
jgi:opacity protein-like surface antigen